MELPRGTLVKSFKGPAPLHELSAALLKDGFSGFMRVSLFKGSFIEGVLVYVAGKPIIAFTSDGKADRPDNEQKAIASAMADEDSAIELFSLTEGQLRLVTDFCRDYAIKRQQPQSPQQPAHMPKPMPVQRPKPRMDERPLSLPEVRGTFIKSESVESLGSYVESRKDETGHAVLTKQDGAGYAEYHILFIHGKAVAAYSDTDNDAGAGPPGYGADFLGQLLAMGGTVEFYHVDEPLIQSIIKMYPHVSSDEAAAKPAGNKPNPEPGRDAGLELKPMEALMPDTHTYNIPTSAKLPTTWPEPIVKTEAAAHGLVTRPPGKAEPSVKVEAVKQPEAPKQQEKTPEKKAGQGIGISAKSLLETKERQAYNVEGKLGTPAPESKSTGTLKGDMDDDADFVKAVEKEFVGNVDELLKRLELSHLKVMPDKKKR